jgi:hypothetical protein
LTLEINVAAIYVDDPPTQDAVLQLLDKAKDCTGIPVKDISKRLKESWRTLGNGG